MKREIHRLRDILLEVEAGPVRVRMQDDRVHGYHAWLLLDGGLAQGQEEVVQPSWPLEGGSVDATRRPGIYVDLDCLTMAGADLLDELRDETMLIKAMDFASRRVQDADNLMVVRAWLKRAMEISEA